MLILLAVPVVLAVVTGHRLVVTFAPTNILIRHFRARQATWGTAAGLALVAAALVGSVHAIGEAVTRGAPGWLNIVVVILAWDAIKLMCASLLTVFARVRRVAAEVAYRRVACSKSQANRT